MPTTPTNGDDTLTGSTGNDTINGLAGNDIINGLAGNDSLIGAAGNDTIDAGTGTDTVSGGADSDRLIVDYSGNNNGNGIITTGFGVDAAGGFLGTYAATGWGSVAFTGIEHFTISGTNYDDNVITGDGNDIVTLASGNDVIRLGKGIDSADGGAGGVDGVGKDFSAFAAGVTINLGANTSSGTGGTGISNFEYFAGIVGSAFADTFLGTGAIANDTVDGGGGSDTASFFRGTDSFAGGTGTDRLIVDYSGNNNGNGIVTSFSVDSNGGYQGSYTVGGWGSVAFTGIENFTVTGTNYSDSVTTGDGNDIVNLGSGNDLVLLGKGTDSADGGTDIDGVGKDFSTFASGVAIDMIANTSTGTSITNFEYFAGIVGSAFGDTFLGTGAIANDTVDGGGGDDTASFYRGTDSFAGGTGMDRLIADYSGNNNGNGIATSFSVDPAGGFQGSYTVGGWGSVAFTGIENFTVTGTNYSDSVTTGDGNDIVNLGSGNDLVLLGKGTDSADGGAGGVDGVGKDFSAYASGVTIDMIANTSSGASITNFEYFAGIVGSAFADTFLGTGAVANDTVDGGGGSDTASFFRGTDSFTGGAGTDRLIVDYSGNNNGNGIVTSFSADPAGGFQGSYTVGGWGSIAFTGIENFTVSGTNYSDSVTTGDGNDIVNLGSGDDVIRLGKGTDSADGGAGGTDGIGKDFSGYTSGVTLNLPGNSSTAPGGTFTNFEYFAGIVGTAFADTFLGTGAVANDIVDGGAGNDVASFFRNTDSFAGGTGIDRLIVDYSGNNNGNGIVTSGFATDGGSTIFKGTYTVGGWGSIAFTGIENMTVTGTNYSDTLTTGAGSDVVSLGTGDDRVTLGKGIDSADGGAGGTDGIGKDFSSFVAAVTLDLGINASRNTGGTGISNFEYFTSIKGSKYGDNFLGTGAVANDVVAGGLGDDTAAFYRGSDSFDGGGGNDRLIVNYSGNNNGNGIVSTIAVDPAGGHQGSYSIGGWGSVAFTGIENMSITGTSYADTITTGAGNDILIGGSGVDTLNGGAGDDIYGIDSASDIITESAGGGTDAIMSAMLTSYNVATGVANIEGYIYTGASNFTGTGDGGANIFGGGSGNDTLSGAGGIDKVTYLSASTGVSVSLALQGGAQNTVGAGSDLLTGFEQLAGSDFNDTLAGDSGNNSLFGLYGDDVITGGAGDDIIDGGIGVDTASYATATSLVKVNLTKIVGQATTGAGTDTLLSIENLVGSNFNDGLTGDNGDNVLNGGLGNDILSGGKGMDTLIGGAGLDKLTGGGDADLLTGGTEADRFIFKTLLDSPTTAQDRITDFSHIEGDKIDLLGIDGDLVTAGHQPLSFIGTAPFSAAGQLRAEFSGGDTLVLIDQDGDGVADMSFLLTGNIILMNNDFLL